MNRKQKNRLIGILAIIVIIRHAVGLILYALKQNINLFYTPTQLAASDCEARIKFFVLVVM